MAADWAEVEAEKLMAVIYVHGDAAKAYVAKTLRAGEAAALERAAWVCNPGEQCGCRSRINEIRQAIKRTP